MSKLTSIVPPSVRRRIKLQLHKGTAYTCPFCDYRAKDLAPAGHSFPVLVQRAVVGGGVRPSKCWNCGSSDRERLIFLYLKDVLRFFESSNEKSVLHVAPEKRLSRFLMSADIGRYECGDLFAEGYNPPAYVRNLDVLDLPFDQDTFDLVMCNHVLEHIESDGVAMAELHRVLKRGGIAILQVPISANSPRTLEDFSITNPRQREQTFGQFDHVRIYGHDYADRLRAVGFKVERLSLASQYARYGVNPNEELFICSR